MKPVYNACHQTGSLPIIPLRKTPTVKQGKHLPPTCQHGEFGRLKHEYGLAPLRVRGLDRVQLHTDLTMLAALSAALARASCPTRSLNSRYHSDSAGVSLTSFPVGSPRRQQRAERRACERV